MPAVHRASSGLGCAASQVRMLLNPRGQHLQGPLSVSLTTGTLAARSLDRRLGKQWHQPEVGLHGLEAFCLGVGDVVDERSEHRLVGEGDGRQSVDQPRGVDARQPAAADVAGVPLKAGQLPGEEEILAIAVLEGWPEQGGPVDVRVPMHRAVWNPTRL